MAEPQLIITIRTNKPRTVEVLLSNIIGKLTMNHPELDIDWGIRREPIIKPNFPD